MKIIFSPSKGMRSSFSDIKNYNFMNSLKKEPFFFEEAMLIMDTIKIFSKSEMMKIFKLKGDLLEKTYFNYENFNNLEARVSILQYQGVSFKNLDFCSYSITNLEYLENHLRVFSALYGVLTPFTLIKEYRLDMTIKILKESPYSYWSKKINSYFSQEELIVNLASNEFSKIIDRKIHNVIDIEVRQKQGDILKNISTEGKKMRGKFLDYMAKNDILDIEKLKLFEDVEYKFSPEMSEERKFIFVKE